MQKTVGFDHEIAVDVIVVVVVVEKPPPTLTPLPTIFSRHLITVGACVKHSGPFASDTKLNGLLPLPTPF